ncbi:HAD hydrolase-like protein [Paenibacillus yanchengensis]|uniref:HAD hydrolase-like protein n=1 Tax=Paenibacillus yanchengensis TaxID=2035833 RepID=A0ABW4YLK5_9BACL
MQQKPEAIIFDMDGTLLETESLLVHVHKRLFDTLREEGLYVEQPPKLAALLGCLGMLLEDIWKKLMPNSSQAARDRADELMLQYEIEGLAAGEGDLYPGVVETLEKLQEQGVRLFVASNGLEQYIRKIVHYKQMEPLFTDLYSAGQYETASKVDLVRLLLHKYEITSAWMVGDRSSDIEAAKKNGLVAIGCAYAKYGQSEELNEADILISQFSELETLLAQTK